LHMSKRTKKKKNKARPLTQSKCCKLENKVEKLTATDSAIETVDDTPDPLGEKHRDADVEDSTLSFPCICLSFPT